MQPGYDYYIVLIVQSIFVFCVGTQLIKWIGTEPKAKQWTRLALSAPIMLIASFVPWFVLDLFAPQYSQAMKVGMTLGGCGASVWWLLNNFMWQEPESK